jgi:hypothetical protein
MPWWGAVLTALALTAVGALFNELTSKTLGLPFQVLYTIGCVLAVTFVRRRSLFGPMVQPPLIMIIVAGVVLALFAGGASAGLAAKAIAIGPPLIGNFPVMAIATVLTVVIGAIRLILQRKPRPDEDEDFPPAARAVRREPSGREDRDPAGRDREPPRREPAPRPAGARSRPAPPPARDRERPDRDRQQPPPPQRQVPPGRGGAPGGRPAAPGGGQRGGMPPRPAAPGRGGGGRPGGGQGRPPQPPPRRPRRPDDDEY